MSAIRLLILGVLQRQQRPIHGYEIRRELELWSANQWANIAYGSIYSALNKMAQEGLVQQTSPSEEPRSKPTARIEYTITPAGQTEFARLLREYWWENKTSVDPFQIALMYMDMLPRDELLLALRNRADLTRANLRSLRYFITLKEGYPEVGRFVLENLGLMAAHVETELRWIEQTLEKVERGELP
ncbi:PadR family transcriptional regulator [Ktedonosporobacter rubrisoli]|uniref:PadR family transcriptional regulator n=1 Tax=Ktedonosporobacter rubrisoli TaxID=2509675 RepID=A0A4P6JZJ2_KTERU|nr:PadR family transcriptional regulator [Ktedonosporobacter rubrisoli]QBD81164.1 PadR family transcriptional regulator [Ktedonosporobacter rubrisoli]